MSEKRNDEDELDTETTFVDMNVEGFRWYDPSKKNGTNSRKGGGGKQHISRKEYWRMVRAAFAAYLPVIAIVVCVFCLMGVIGYLWVS